jgi:hypothetical protein
MKVNYFIFFLMAYLALSCDFLKEKLQEDLRSQLDTVIDYHQVDALPAFPFCKDLLDTEEQNNCFRNRLHLQLSENLSTHTFAVSNTLFETVRVRLRIDSSGTSELLSIASSERVKKELPLLDSLLRKSIANLPVVFPAIKRGIPVATVHEIPIILHLD